MLAFVLTHWFQYFYVPAHGSWFEGNVWGNAMVLLVLGPLGWVWSRTKFWPLRPIRHGIGLLHAKVDEHHAELLEHHEHQSQLIEEMHHLAHTSEEHPRVLARREAGLGPTPPHP